MIEPKPVTLEAVGNQVCVFNKFGALCGCDSLPELFRQHDAGEILILNINRPDLAECYAAWRHSHFPSHSHSA